MKRVLLIADPIGGVWTYSIDLARALGDRGVSMVLATMGAALRNEQRQEATQLSNVELHESEFALEWMEKPWADVERAGRWLLQLEATTKPELVHLNGYAHAALSWQAPVLVVAHSCVLSWWRAVKGAAAPNEWDEYRRRVTAGLHAADFVVAPSHAMLSSLAENYGSLPRVGVIQNGRDPRLFRSGLKEPLVFSAGRFWDEGKNLAAMEKAAAAINWPVEVAGSAGSNGAVVRLGYLSARQIASRLARASIFCLPARYEPFGLSALEAALSGCALVLGDIPSLREVWGEAALFVDLDDTNGLVAALQQLILDRTHREELARRAQERAQQFTLERMADRYLSLYSELVRQFRWAENAA
jgi:glycogen(starch) synthase